MCDGWVSRRRRVRGCVRGRWRSLSRFRRYLAQERGLVPAAARGYVDKVRPFVARFDAPDGLELWRVDVAEVRGFVVDVCPRLGRRSAQLTVVALRSLLRFLHLDGLIERSLAGAVPSVFAPREWASLGTRHLVVIAPENSKAVTDNRFQCHLRATATSIASRRRGKPLCLGHRAGQQTAGLFRSALGSGSSPSEQQPSRRHL
jgi:hypothetical protein